MEQQQLNKVELKGIVGAVRTKELSGKMLAQISVATNFAYRDKDRNPVIETTWHNVTAWEGKDVKRSDLEKLAKGSKVHIIGRIRQNRYTDMDGVEKYQTEILAHTLKFIEEQDSLSFPDFG